MATFEGREEQIVKIGDPIHVVNKLNWVPVNERNPDKKRTYLVTRRWINPDTHYIDICLWCANKWFTRNAYINLTDVIAWVDGEIEPYKGD